jgi:hypothetical protein
LDAILTPVSMDFSNFRLKRGEVSTRVLILEGRGITLDLLFDEVRAPFPPLITVIFNGRVVYENYLKENTISMDLAAVPGENELQIRAVNRDVLLVRLSYRVNPENSTALPSGRPE